MTIPPLDARTRRRLTERFGPEAGGWLDALPRRAADLARRWGVVLDDSGRSEGGRTSVVLRGRLGDGRPVVLKLTYEPAIAAAEADALTAWGRAADAAPVPRVHARDDDAGALLMEAIEPGRPLGDDVAAASTSAVGTLLRALRAPAPPPAAEPLATRVDWCFELWLQRRAQSEAARTAVPTGTLERGHRLAAGLAADPAGPRAFVHGDLHPGNVLDGGPARGLVAIDPRPCVGDPGWDAVDLALWAVEDIADAERRIAELAAATDGDAERLRAWCAALAAMSAASLAIRPDKPHAHERRIALLLALAA